MTNNRKGFTENRESIIRFRVTKEERENIECRAEKARMSVSEYTRKAVLYSRTRISKSGSDMARSIAQGQAELNILDIEVKRLAETGEIDIACVTERIAAVQKGLDEIWRLSK